MKYNVNGKYLFNRYNRTGINSRLKNQERTGINSKKKNQEIKIKLNKRTINPVNKYAFKKTGKKQGKTEAEKRTDLILKIDMEYLFIKAATEKILKKLNNLEQLKEIILDIIGISESEIIEDYFFNNYVNKLSNQELQKIINENEKFI